jgi:hypothetical protein
MARDDGGCLTTPGIGSGARDGAVSVFVDADPVDLPPDLTRGTRRIKQRTNVVYVPAPTPACKFCGKPFPQSNRRPQEYCSNAHRQADYRKRRQEAIDASGAPTYRVAKKNAPVTVSPENYSTISKAEFRNTEVLSIPLNLLGGFRWPEAGSASILRPPIRAVIDAEIGIGFEVISPDDVRCSVITPRRAR